MPGRTLSKLFLATDFRKNGTLHKSLNSLDGLYPRLSLLRYGYMLKLILQELTQSSVRADSNRLVSFAVIW